MLFSPTLQLRKQHHTLLAHATKTAFSSLDTKMLKYSHSQIEEPKNKLACSRLKTRSIAVSPVLVILNLWGLVLHQTADASIAPFIHNIRRETELLLFSYATDSIVQLLSSCISSAATKSGVYFLGGQKSHFVNKAIGRRLGELPSIALSPISCVTLASH